MFIKLALWLILPIAAMALDVNAPYHIVFIHLGRQLPSFLPIALKQAKLFNPQAEIVLVANKEALDRGDVSLEDFACVTAESLRKTIEHSLFVRTTNLDKTFRDGFWFFTTERLFYLNDLICQYDLKNTFHLENDVLLYADLGEMLPVFVQHYPGMAIPYEQDDRGAASLVYIADQKSVDALAKYIYKHCRSDKSEMYLISYFKTEFGPEYADHLPNITYEYGADHNPLVHLSGRVDKLGPEWYSRHFDQFQSLFDACSYGQYLGGIDPRNGPDGPGYLNPCSIFNCSRMEFVWENDEQGRKVPYAIYKGKKTRINNLHIHCKDLKKFASVDFQ